MNFLYDTPVIPVLGKTNTDFGIVAQLVEQGPFKAKVAGSSPANPTIFRKIISPRYEGIFYVDTLSMRTMVHSQL